MWSDLKLAIRMPFFVLKSFLMLATSAKLMFLSSIPSIIGFIVFSILSYLSVANKTWLYSLTGFDINSWYAGLASWFLALVSVFISAVCAFIVVNIFLGFIIESIVVIVISKHSVDIPSTKDVSWFNSTLRVALNETGLLLIFGILTLLALLLSFIPPLAFIAFCISSILGGYSLCSIALLLMQADFKTRSKFPFRYPIACLSLGIIFSGILVMPFVGMLLLPVLYCTATLFVLNAQLGERRL